MTAVSNAELMANVSAAEEEEELSEQEVEDAASAASESPIWLPRNTERAHQRRWKTRLRKAYDERILFWSCMADELDFARFGKLVDIPHRGKYSESDFYIYQNNGSKILAVAHLDSVDQKNRFCRFYTDHNRGPVVRAPTLDDRLGAYVITDLLPSVGIKTDILLTVGEEQGQSTAEFFKTNKQYNWMFQFDRTGTDVVMYQFDTPARRQLLRSVHAWPAFGAFSDISFLSHLKCAGFNWGVGYHDYHGPQAWASLGEMFQQAARFARFYERYSGLYMAHSGSGGHSSSGYGSWGGWNDDDWELTGKGWRRVAVVKEGTEGVKIAARPFLDTDNVVRWHMRGNGRDHGSKRQRNDDILNNRCPICNAICIDQGCEACGWPHPVDEETEARTDRIHGMTEDEWERYNRLSD
jgi:hypothetical protein